MPKQVRREYLREHDDEVFSCFFCGEDVEREKVVVRREDSSNEDSEWVATCRRCHNEMTHV